MTLRESRPCARRSQTPPRNSIFDGLERHAKLCGGLRLRQASIEQRLKLRLVNVDPPPVGRPLRSNPATLQVRTKPLLRCAVSSSYLRNGFAPVNGLKNG